MCAERGRPTMCAIVGGISVVGARVGGISVALRVRGEGQVGLQRTEALNALDRAHAIAREDIFPA
jgi:hypothetical protein